ncbi:MAG: hypothetical protein JWR19_1824 [Pedosphaera sp.]|nr:hypothetical protein [Pedosphaera sp.]
MARKLRIQYPGAVSHVLNRGDRREPNFQADADRALFLATLAQACAKTRWQVQADCLMPNHFHLVLETPQANLVAGMKRLAERLAMGGGTHVANLLAVRRRAKR